MKNIFVWKLKIFLLLLLFILTIFLMVYFCVVNYLETYLKIIIGSVLVLFSILEFKAINRINSRMIKDIDIPEEQIDKFDYVKEKSKFILCPKCYKPYDGNCCFYCGYIKKN